MANTLFEILLGIDAMATLAIGYFFAVGLADGSVSAFNGQLWTDILFVVAAIIASGIALRKADKPAFANIILAILAIPTMLYGTFTGAVIISTTPWN